MVKGYIFDGRKNIGLEQYPAAAWTDLRGDGNLINDSRSDTLQAQGLYEAVAVLYRCVEIRANALTRIPWAIMRGDDEVWHSSDHQPPNSLSHMRNFRRLLWNTEACICLAPEAFWFNERNRARTTGYKWLAPTSVLPVWDVVDGLIGFDRTTSRGTRRFEPEDIVYIPRLNPMHETIPGRPPAQAAMAAAGVIYSVDDFAAGFFERGAIKATLLTVEGNPAQAEIKRLETWWKRFFSGVKNAWEAAAVRMGVTPVIVGEGIKELGNTELTEEKRQDIATGMGVMHSLLFSNSANFATAEQDAMNFQSLTMIPELEIIFEWLNEQIFEPQGLFIKERSEEMSIFQQDENERGDALKKYVEAGVPVHVAAEILGINLPAGMEYADLDTPEPEVITAVEPSPTEPVAMLEDTQAVEQEKSRFRRWASKRKNPKPSAYESQLLTDEMKYAILDDLAVKGGKDAATDAANFQGKALVLQLDPDDDEAEQESRMEVESRATNVIGRALREQADALMPDSDGDVPTMVSRVDETSETVSDALRRMLIASSDLGVQIAVRQMENVGLSFDWTLANIAARDWANQYTGELVSGINDTTRRTIRQSVAAWIENGDPLSELAKELEPLFGRERAELISSTEVTKAFANANRLAYVESGVVDEIEWRTANDERVCPICGPRHGTRSDVNEPDFGGLSIPPAHPRCRCWITAAIDN